MTSATKFNVDDITLAFSEEDYKPKVLEPRCDLWFEMRVSKATVALSKRDTLQLSLVCEALNSDGKQMFRKYLNFTLPITMGLIVAPEYSKGLWLQGMRAFFPEDAAYDKSETDSITGERIFYKAGEQVRPGKELEQAKTEANRTQGNRAKVCAKLWVEHGDNAEVADFVGKTFFAKTKRSKDGKYINLQPVLPELPSDATAVYDTKEAFAG